MHVLRKLIFPGEANTSNLSQSAVRAHHDSTVEETAGVLPIASLVNLIVPSELSAGGPRMNLTTYSD